MKHLTWLICYTTAMGLPKVDLQNRFSMSDQSQAFASQFRYVNSVLPEATLSRWSEDDRRADTTTSNFKSIGTHSDFDHASQSRKHDASRVASISFSEVLQQFRSAQTTEPIGVDWLHKLSKGVDQLAIDAGINRLEQSGLQSRLQSTALHTGARTKYERQISTVGTSGDRDEDHPANVVSNADMRVCRRQSLEVLMPRNSNLDHNLPVPLEEGGKPLVTRSVLLPRGKRSKAGKRKKSESPRRNPSPTRSNSSPSRGSTKGETDSGYGAAEDHTVPYRSPVPDPPVILRPDYQAAKAGVHVQGYGSAHTSNPSEGVTYVPAVLTKPAYRLTMHHDQVVAGAKIHHHPSGYIGSVAVHAEGRTVQLNMEPERHSQAWFEVHPNGIRNNDPHIRLHGAPVQQRFRGLQETDRVRVIANLVGPGYVSLMAHNRGQNTVSPSSH